ncbi:hypothetical protein GCM10022240_02930 [Microbacterium kribbense]|uniref:N-acetyltransferase n=1 Tax=Microbacterium kribbense TaxID=433645 RepID=A0ABP7G3V1_9MICO
MSFTDPSAPIPAGLRTAEFVLRPITAEDAAQDHAAVMETRADLRLWEQSTWPADDFTVDDNREDLIGLERRHAAGRAFTYTVLDPDGADSLGCVYVFATDAAFLARSLVTPVTDHAWADVDAVIYFWVRASRVKTGMDGRLLAALRTWFRDEWQVRCGVYVTNEQFIQQLELLRSTDLSLRFELREPGKPGTYLAFG